MIGALVAGVATLAGGTYTWKKGIAVKRGTLPGPQGLQKKWRVRWALTRWKAEVWTPRGGWREVVGPEGTGDFATPELARGAAIAKAMGVGAEQNALTQVAGVSATPADTTDTSELVSLHYKDI